MQSGHGGPNSRRLRSFPAARRGCGYWQAGFLQGAKRTDAEAAYGRGVSEKGERQAAGGCELASSLGSGGCWAESKLPTSSEGGVRARGELVVPSISPNSILPLQ